MKIWVDDIRPAPDGYIWCKSVYAAINLIDVCDEYIEIIDLDHDAGDFYPFGGDYINILNWLEEIGRNYPVRIHSQNVVGRMNMEAICRKNNWTIID